MSLILKNGSYVPDGKGGFLQSQGRQALLNEALFRLNCRRGAFPLLPDLGSRLYTLAREKPAARNMAARQYAAEALEGLALSVRDAEVSELKNGELLVTVYLSVENTDAIIEVNA